MLTVRRGPLVRLVLVGVLLLPAVSVARAASACAVSTVVSPPAETTLVASLGASLGAAPDLACRTVLAAVSSWDGRAVVRVVDGDDGVAAETLGSTVSVHRRAWATLTPAGRQAVLTHELVHVATDSFTTPGTPTWLVEGLAEAIALRSIGPGGSGLPDRVVAQELTAAVVRGHLPTALPSARDFATTPALAYQESWLAVDLLLRRFGDAAVLRAYSAAGVTSVEEALAVLGTSARSGNRWRDLEGTPGDYGWPREASSAAERVAPGRITAAGLVAALRSELVRRLS